MSSMIEKALAKTSVVEYADASKLAAEEARLQELHDSMFGIERDAREQLQRRIQAIQQERTLSTTSQKLEGLQLLDPEVFSWTKPQRAWRNWLGGQTWLDVPVFAYIRLSEATCILRAAYNGVNARSELPPVVFNHYRPALQAMQRHTNWEGREAITLHYSYPGVIPNHVREIIQQERHARRFSKLALVCEVDAWKINTEHAPARDLLDPILVGEQADSLWVLTSFDPTSVEQYLLDEFTK